MWIVHLIIRYKTVILMAHVSRPVQLFGIIKKKENNIKYIITIIVTVDPIGFQGLG